MSDLSFGFTLDDGMSAGLKNITEALSEINDYLEDVDKSIDSVDSQNFNNLKKNINQACGSIDEIGQEFDQAAKSATGLNNTGLSNIQKTANQISRSVSDIENSASSATSALKKTSNVNFSGLKGDIGSVEDNLSDLKKEAKEAKGSLDDIGDVDLAGAIGGLTSAIDLSNFLNLTELAEGLVQTMFDLGEAGLESAQTINDAINTISMGLGTTAEQTSNLYDIAKNVFTSGYGESIGDVTQRLTYMKQVFGDLVSDSELETLLPQFLSLDDAGMDFNETLRGVKNLVTSFGVDAQTATNYMVAGMQQGLNISDELGDNIAEYAARWAEGRVPLENYFSLLKAGVDNSSYSLDKVGDFLNEFMTSLIDGRMESAMGSLSENSRNMFESYQAGGANAQDVLNAVLTDFQNMTSETDRAAAASEIWSSLGEDNAMGMIMSLNGITNTMGDVSQAGQDLANANTNAVSTLQNRWDQWKNDTLAPIGNFLAQMALNVWDWFNQTGTAISDTISNVSNRWNEIIAGFQTFEATLKSKLEGLPGWFSEVGSNIINGLKGGLETAWTSVTTWFNDNFGWIIDNIKSMFGIASPSKVFNDIGGNVIWGFLEGAQTIWNNVTGWIEGAVGGFIDTVKGAWDRLTGKSPDTPGADIDYSETIKRVQGQLDQLKKMVQEAFEQINAQASSIAKMSQSVIQSFISMVTSSINSVVTLETTTVSTVTEMVSKLLSLTESLRNELITIWVTVQTTTISTIKIMATQVIATIQSMCSSILAEVRKMPDQMRQVGVAMMSSFKAGIESQRASVSDTASSIIQQLKTTFETGLGIHSPSDYMIWVGQMMLAGLLEGMSNDKVQKFIDNLIGDMQTSFKNGSFDPGQLVNFLSDQGTLDLIGRISGMDLGDMNPEQIFYPLVGTLGTQTSWFGPRESPGGIGSTNHGGVDLAADTGTPIAAALGGTVTTAGWYGGYGNAVVIDSGNGIDITYGHMSKVLAQVGQTVAKGTQIGLVGSTGNSTGPHLHFEMHQNGQRIDPQPYIEGASISAGNTLVSAIQNAYNMKHGIFSSSSPGNISYDISAGASQWSGLVLQALSMLGQPASLLNAVLATLQKESSGNPNAINKEDINWINGTPSKGLMQVIDPTFSAYALPGYNTNIWDPLSNILASLNYQLHRYGGIEAHLNGYAVGTRYVPGDMLAMLHKGEAVLPAGQNPYTQSGGDYLADLIGSAVDSYGFSSDEYAWDMANLEPGLSAESFSTSGTTTTNKGPVNITLNVNQSITDSSNARAIADEVMDMLYEEIEQQFAGSGGGVSYAY